MEEEEQEACVMQRCPFCEQDTGLNHEPGCPNAETYIKASTNASDPNDPDWMIWNDKDEKIRLLRSENEMLRAEIGRLKEALSHYEMTAGWDT